MDGLDNILEEIRREAAENVSRIEEQANKEAQTILSESEEDAEKRVQEIRDRQDREVRTIQRRAASAGDLKRRQAVLEKKQELIQKTMERTLERASGLPEEEYFDLLNKILAGAVHSGEKGRICLNQRDMDRLKNSETGSTVISLATFRKELDKNALELGNPVEIRGGFLLIYPGIDENCSLEEIMSANQEEFRDEIRDILFRKDIAKEEG